mgnify:CR=1 FL=1
MGRKILKIFLLILLFAVGLGGGLGAGYYQLKKERAVHEKELTRTQGQLKAFQKKYQETRSRSDALMRAKYVVEGEKKKLEEELAQMKENSTSNQGRLSALAGEIAGLKKKLKAANSENKELRNKLALDGGTIKSLEKDHQTALKERDALQVRLTATERTLGRCQKNNKELYTTSMDILRKFENKGFFETLLEQEKFTNLKRVELEHQLQDYEDTIVNNRFE